MRGEIKIPRMKNVFKLLNMIPVAGHHVDIMAAVRQELRILDEEVWVERMMRPRSAGIEDIGVGEDPGEPGVDGEVNEDG